MSVHSAGVQPFDALVRNGRIEMDLTSPQQIGNEFAGTVVAAGSDTTHDVGDHVLGWAPLASHAERVVVEEAAVVGKPSAMDWDTAGAIGASGQTALVRLHLHGALDVRVRDRHSLDGIADTHRAIERGHGHGRLVIAVAHTRPTSADTCEKRSS